MAEESTATLRSKTVDVIGTVMVLIGIAGFSVCWGIGWNSEQQVLGRAELRHPSVKRTAPIEMKGVTWFVEPSFAQRYNTADGLIGVFWAVGAAGGIIKERKRITKQLRESRRLVHLKSGMRSSNQPSEPDAATTNGSPTPFGWAVWVLLFSSAIVLALVRGAGVIKGLFGHS